MTKPYYEHNGITIYHGDCRDVLPLLEADVLITDPPYGIGWRRGENQARGSAARLGIQGDEDVSLRDCVVEMWLPRPVVAFGSFDAPPPPGRVQTLVWHKPPDAGVVGSVTGFRRDAEPIFLCGCIPQRTVEWSSVLKSVIPSAGNPSSPAGLWGHPHAKPEDLMRRLIELFNGTILDPFMGSGTTLRAAKDLGRKAIGIEIEERYCETAAKRLSQEVLL